MMKQAKYDMIALMYANTNYSAREIADIAGLGGVASVYAILKKKGIPPRGGRRGASERIPLLEEYREFLLSSGKSDHYASVYVSRARGFLKYLNEQKIELNKIDHEHVIRYLNLLRTDKYFSTIKSGLNKFLNYLFLQKIIINNLVSEARMMKDNKPISEYDVELLLDCIPRYTLAGIVQYIIVRISVECGLELQDILNIQCSDVDLNSRFINFRDRKFSISQETKKEIDRYINNFRFFLKTTESTLLLSSKGEPVAYAVALKNMVKYRKIAGVHISFNQLQQLYINNCLKRKGGRTTDTGPQSHSND